MADALYGVLTLLAVCTLAVVPLAVVLPSSPPMFDDAKTVAQPRRAGWRISITVARTDGPKASA